MNNQEKGDRALRTMFLVIKHTARQEGIIFNAKEDDAKELIDKTVEYCFTAAKGEESREEVKEYLKNTFGSLWQWLLGRNTTKFLFFHDYLIRRNRDE